MRALNCDILIAINKEAPGVTVILIGNRNDDLSLEPGRGYEYLSCANILENVMNQSLFPQFWYIVGYTGLFRFGSSIGLGEKNF